MRDFGHRHDLAVCSRQSAVENTIQPKAESFKFKTSYLEPRTLYRHGEAVYLEP
jgi:hypothetical protein